MQAAVAMSSIIQEIFVGVSFHGKSMQLSALEAISRFNTKDVTICHSFTWRLKSVIIETKAGAMDSFLVAPLYAQRKLEAITCT